MRIQLWPLISSLSLYGLASEARLGFLCVKSGFSIISKQWLKKMNTFYIIVCSFIKIGLMLGVWHLPERVWCLDKMGLKGLALDQKGFKGFFRGFAILSHILWLIFLVWVLFKFWVSLGFGVGGWDLGLGVWAQILHLIWNVRLLELVITFTILRIRPYQIVDLL